MPPPEAGKPNLFPTNGWAQSAKKGRPSLSFEDTKELLKIALFPEVKIQTQRDQDHERHNRKITVAPLEFRHEFEIHAIDARDRGDHYKYRAPRGEPLHRHVELIRGGSEMDLERA